MPRLPLTARGLVFRLAFMACWCVGLSRAAVAQEQPPPAYLAVVEGVATIEHGGGESEPAVRDMPFVEGDRLRTGNGRVEIQFPDGTAIEVGEDSLVEALSPTRVRLLAGTMDHLQRAAPPPDAQPAMSASYLPSDLRPYGNTFDQYGSWQYAAPYGYVWYPTVAPGWRPYYYGRWYSAPSYGWTWLGVDPWAYPTHHYGRWGYSRNAWFWIPGRSWGAAWVSWGAAPDYVSWCPLGFDNRPVFALSVNSYDSWRRGGGQWFGWTVMSRSHFGGRGYDAHRYAVDARSLPSDTPFIVSSRPPSGLPHQSRRQSPVASDQSSVASRSVAGRQLPSAGRRSAADDRQFAVPRRPAADAAAASAVLPGADSRIASPRVDYGVPRRYRPSDDSQAVPERPRMYPMAVPRSAEPAAPIVAPQYRAPGRPFDSAQGRPVDGAQAPRRWNPTLGAAPHSYGAPAPAAPSAAPAPRSFGAPIPPAPAGGAVPRSFGAPVQRGPAAAPAPAPAAAPSPAQGARPAPSGAARDGGARQRSSSDGAPQGARRR